MSLLSSMVIDTKIGGFVGLSGYLPLAKRIDEVWNVILKLFFIFYFCKKTTSQPSFPSPHTACNSDKPMDTVSYGTWLR